MLLNPGFRIGKQGVEKALDLQLRGKAGGKKVEVDAKGRVVREDPGGDIPSGRPARHVQLTLDADIQNRALEVFGERERRGGDDGLPHRRHALHALGAELRRQPLRQGPHRAGVPGAGRLRAQAAVQQGADRHLSAGLDLQDHGGADGAGERHPDPARTYTCNGCWSWGGRPWHCDQRARHARHARAASPTRATSTSTRWRCRSAARTRSPRRRATFGLGQTLRHRHPGPEARADPGHRLQAQGLSQATPSGTRARRPAWASARAT